MISLTAQISVYPLRQTRLSPAIHETVWLCQSHEVIVRHGRMSTVVAGDHDEIFTVLKAALRSAAAEGEVVMVVTLSNACRLQPAGET